MRTLLRTLVGLAEGPELWLSLAGLVLVGAGMAITLLHWAGYFR